MTQHCIVADAGPLIALARIERLNLLRRLFPLIVVPAMVYAECIRIPEKPGATRILQAKQAGWLDVRVPEQEPDFDHPSTLGRGEVSAVMLALELAAPVLMDDKLARSFARGAGVQVIGTGGLLIAAKTRSLIPAVRPVLEELAGAGYYLSDELTARILALAREDR